MDFSTEVKIKLQTLILIFFFFFFGFNFSLSKLQINLHMKYFSLLFEILLLKQTQIYFCCLKTVPLSKQIMYFHEIFKW